MWDGLRDLFGGLSPRGRFWLAVFVTMTLSGTDTGAIVRLLLGA